MMRALIVVLALFGAIAPVAAARSVAVAHASAVCADYPNQAAAAGAMAPSRARTTISVRNIASLSIGISASVVRCWCVLT